MTAQGSTHEAENDLPPEVADFLDAVPLFQMVEFMCFPDVRITSDEWQTMQEELLSTDPATTTLRVLTPLPSGDMVCFDLKDRDAGYPLGTCEIGFPENAVDEPLSLTVSKYLDLAKELAPCEAAMQTGTFPYDDIVAVIDRRGLRETDYWGNFLELLAEGREDTLKRMEYIRQEAAEGHA